MKKYHKYFILIAILIFFIKTSFSQQDSVKKNSFSVSINYCLATEYIIHGVLFQNQYDRHLNKYFSISYGMNYIYSEKEVYRFKDKDDYQSTLLSGNYSGQTTDGAVVYTKIKGNRQSHIINSLKFNFKIQDSRYHLFKIGVGPSVGYFNETFMFSVENVIINDGRKLQIYSPYYIRIIDFGIDFSLEYFLNINKSNAIGAKIGVNNYFKSDYNFLYAGLSYKINF